MYVIGLCLIFSFASNWKHLQYSLFITYFLLALVAIYSLVKLKSFKITFSKNHILESIKICAPLVPHAIGSTLIATSDKFIIKSVIDFQAVAIYSAGYMLGSSSQLIIESVNKVWSPYVYKQLNSITDEKKAILIKTTYIFYLALPFLCLLSAFAGKMCLIFLPIEYHKLKKLFIGRHLL